MTKQEFEQQCETVLRTYGADNLMVKKATVSEEQYRQIEVVYNFHPCISEICGKRQIAELYMEFGMAIIRDMTWRANHMKDLEEQQRKLRAQLQEVEDDIREAREGWNE